MGTRLSQKNDDQLGRPAQPAGRETSVLDLEITTRCNQRCRYCFVRKLGRRGEMSLELVEDALEEGGRLGHRTVHLTGGEPLLHPQLDDIIELSAEQGYERVIVNTNGTLLNDTRADQLAAHPIPVHVTISLDGDRRCHERNRGRKTYDAAVSGIDAALGASLTVSLFTVVTSELVGVLDDILCRTWARFPGLSGVSLIPIGSAGDGEHEDDDGQKEALSPDDLLEVVLTSATHLLCGRPVTIMDYPIANLVYRRLGLPVERIGSHCNACRGRICIQADGVITPCHPCWAPLGHYRKGNLAAVTSSRLAEAISDRDFEGCSSCPDRDICSSCRATVLASGQSLFGNDGACVGVREALRKRGGELAARLEENLARHDRRQLTASARPEERTKHVAVRA